FRQSGARTPQCTMLGALTKPSDESVLKKLSTRWQKKFGEEIDQDLLYLISVDRILHMEDFNEDGMWVVPSDYTSAEPDPLRNFAENIVEEFNNKNAEDVRRIYNIYVESDLQDVLLAFSHLFHLLISLSFLHLAQPLDIGLKHILFATLRYNMEYNQITSLFEQFGVEWKCLFHVLFASQEFMLSDSIANS
ncbi:hypothetical protein ACJX0J_019619, partial [Zea mays]